MDRSDEHSEPGRSPRLTLAGLFVFAVAVRAATALRTSVIFADGPSFVRLAEQMQASDWQAVFLHPYHPLYPAAMWGLYGWTGDFETAGVAVSILAGGVSVLALYGFLHAAFDRRIATVGALLLCVLPYAVRFSSDVQSDGIYLALFLAAVATLWRALSDRSVGLALLAGVGAGLAYLARPEGLGVALAGLLLAGGQLLWRRWTARQLTAWSVALVAGVALPAGPYLLMLGESQGQFVFSAKKSLSSLLGIGGALTPVELLAAAGLGVAAVAAAVVTRGGRGRGGRPRWAHWGPVGWGAVIAGGSAALWFVPTVAEFGGVAVSSLGPGIFGLTVLGVLAGRRERAPARAVFLCVFLGLYAAVLFALLWNHGYLSRRHMLPPLTLLLGYAAAGVFVLAGWLRRLAASLAPTRALSAGASLAVILLAVGLTELPKTLRRHREDALAHRRAAEWLREQEGSAGRVAAVKLRTAYYAGRGWVPLRPLVDGAIESSAIGEARFVIVDRETDGSLERTPSLDLVELHRVEAAGELVRVYRVVRRDS